MPLYIHTSWCLLYLFQRSGFDHDFFFIERNLSIILRIKNWDKSKNCGATPELPFLIGPSQICMPEAHFQHMFIGIDQTNANPKEM